MNLLRAAAIISITLIFLLLFSGFIFLNYCAYLKGLDQNRPMATIDFAIATFFFDAIVLGISYIVERPIIISLFDYSGAWSENYRRAGYRVLQIEKKLGFDVLSWDYKAIRKDLVKGILAAPPCTDFSISGAQYWPEKDKDGRTAQSVELVKKTLEIIHYFDEVEFWALENPVGRIANLVPELQKYGPWYFQPFWYGDAWTKKTGLWGKFNPPIPINMVEPIRYNTQGSWLQSLGGKSERTKELRSITPKGFSKAFFEANKVATVLY